MDRVFVDPVFFDSPSRFKGSVSIMPLQVCHFERMREILAFSTVKRSLPSVEMTTYLRNTTLRLEIQKHEAGNEGEVAGDDEVLVFVGHSPPPLGGCFHGACR